MSTLNGVAFKQWLVDASKYDIKAPYSMTAKKITVHNTDNQMSANNEISYMRNNNAQVSYHLAIDESIAIQGLPYNRNGWHCGDGGNGYGNRNTIGVEICRNYDRTRGTTNLNEPLKSFYNKAEANAIKVIAQLCINQGIVASVDTIKKHQDWSGKWCPSKILNEKRWPAFQQSVIAEYNRLKGKPATKPVAPSKNGIYTVKAGDTLWGIATANKVTVANLKSWNKLTSDVIQPGQKLNLNGAQAPAASKPSTPAKGSDEKITSTKKESETFIPNRTIQVYDKPNTGGKVVATYYNGEPLTYHTVHIGNKHVWVQYTRSGGKGEGYLIVRNVTNGKMGALHGTIPEKKAVAQKKTYISLSKTVSAWRIYPLGVAPVKGNEKGFLNPAQSGGLTYELLGYEDNKATAIIQTRDFGKGKIFIDSDARIYTK